MCRETLSFRQRIFFIYTGLLLCHRAPEGLATCPPEEMARAGTCYKFIATTGSWASSKASCELYGGRLVSILDNFTAIWIKSKVIGNQSLIGKTFWIGAQAQKQFDWIDGDTVSWTNWFSGQPNNVNIWDDGIMLWYGEYGTSGKDQDLGNYRWKNVYKNTLNSNGVISKYICQKAGTSCSTLSSTCTSSGVDLCVDISGDCFILSGPLQSNDTSLGVDWSTAKYKCEQDGTTLARIDNVNIQAAIADKIQLDLRFQGNYWIGASLNVSATLKNWRWTDGTHVNVLDPVESFPTYGLLCMTLKYVTTPSADYKWSNIDCTGSTKSFICEFDEEENTSNQTETENLCNQSTVNPTSQSTTPFNFSGIITIVVSCSVLFLVVSTAISLSVVYWLKQRPSRNHHREHDTSSVSVDCSDDNSEHYPSQHGHVIAPRFNRPRVKIVPW